MDTNEEYYIIQRDLDSKIRQLQDELQQCVDKKYEIAEQYLLQKIQPAPVGAVVYGSCGERIEVEKVELFIGAGNIPSYCYSGYSIFPPVNPEHKPKLHQVFHGYNFPCSWSKGHENNWKENNWPPKPHETTEA